jgi:carboxymethylenebutenolidase
MSKALFTYFLLVSSVIFFPGNSRAEKPEIIYFNNGSIKLGGEIYKPLGQGPFPAVLYNHGSAPGMLNSEASKNIGPKFAAKGWVFFMPYRRGQGLSSDAGPYIGKELEAAHKKGGEALASQRLVELMSGEHLRDQLAAYEWLKSQKFVDSKKIAVDGNSFGGIQTVLGSAKMDYCAAVSASGGAQSWKESPELQKLMKENVRKSKSPILFFQAENDFDLSPTHILSAEMKSAGKTSEVKIYPPFGNSSKEGHSFAYAGSSIWFDDVYSFIIKNCSK